MPSMSMKSMKKSFQGWKQASSTKASSSESKTSCSDKKSCCASALCKCIVDGICKCNPCNCLNCACTTLNNKTKNIQNRSLKFSGVAIVAAAAYIAVTNKDGLNSSVLNGFSDMEYSQNNTKTVKLGECGVSSKGKVAYKGLDDLVMAHSQLGFSASELIEDFARPLEKVWKSDWRNTTDSCPTCPTFTLKKFATDLSHMAEQRPLGFTIPDSFTNFSSYANIANKKMTDLLNNTTDIKTAVDNVTNFVSNMTANVTMGAYNTTGCAFNCTANTLKNMGECAYCEGRNVTQSLYTNVKDVLNNDTRSGNLTKEFEKLMEGPKDGPLRFSVNDAVGKVEEIFSHCKVTQPDQVGVAKRFPSSKVTYVLPESGKVTDSKKVIYETTVSDGWRIEARVVDGLWSNVVVERGDFGLMLKRDRYGIVHAVVDGLELGEI